MVSGMVELREKRNPCVRWLAAYWICWRCVEQMIAQLPPWKNLGWKAARFDYSYGFSRFPLRLEIPTRGLSNEESLRATKRCRRKSREYNRLRTTHTLRPVLFHEPSLSQPHVYVLRGQRGGEISALAFDRLAGLAVGVFHGQVAYRVAREAETRRECSTEIPNLETSILFVASVSSVSRDRE